MWWYTDMLPAGTTQTCYQLVLCYTNMPPVGTVLHRHVTSWYSTTQMCYQLVQCYTDILPIGTTQTCYQLVLCYTDVLPSGSTCATDMYTISWHCATPTCYQVVALVPILLHWCRYGGVVETKSCLCVNCYVTDVSDCLHFAWQGEIHWP